MTIFKLIILLILIHSGFILFAQNTDSIVTSIPDTLNIEPLNNDTLKDLNDDNSTPVISISNTESTDENLDSLNSVEDDFEEKPIIETNNIVTSNPDSLNTESINNDTLIDLKDDNSTPAISISNTENTDSLNSDEEDFEEKPIIEAKENDTKAFSNIDETDSSKTETTLPSSQAINYTDTLIISFLKLVVNQSPDSLYFNILKISNYTDEKISGELSFSFPDGWNLISAQGNILELSPNDSAYIPVRLAINKESIGALSYILNATFKTADAVYSSNAYISIPGFSRWTMSVNKSMVNFNQYNEAEKIIIKLSNKGNVTETIKLEYKLGSLLKSEEINDKKNIQYITIASNKDTTIVVNVKPNADLSYNDRKILERNWKEASLEVTSSSFEKIQKQSVWFKKLYSVYYGEKLGSSSPLNIGIFCSNLLSDMFLRFNTELFGTILFPKDREITYRLNVFGIGVQKESFSNFDLNRHSSFNVTYKDKDFIVSVGDNIGSGVVIGLSGRGAKVQYKIDNTSDISGGIMMSKFVKNSYGGFLNYRKRIYNVGLHTSIGMLIRDYPKSNLFSALIGGNFSPYKGHNISLDLLGTNLNVFKNNDITNNQFNRDTSVYGYGYKIGYIFSFKQFDFRAYYQNYLKSISNANSVIDISAKYRFFKNKRIDFNYNRRKSSNSRFIYSLYTRTLYNSNDIARAILYIPTNYSVTYGIGPHYNANMRQFIDKSNYIAKVTTHNPKLYLTANLRINSYRSVSGYFTAGYANIKYKTENPLAQSVSLKGKGNYSFGSTFSSKVWRINVSYNVGSVSDLWYYVNYQLQFPEYNPIFRTTESIIIRPSYEKSFFENKILLQLMANYAYYLPSKRENLSFSLNSFFNLKRGWSASINANVFFNSVEDEETGRISSKDLNIQVGVRKSFDIQQPRIKYYNLTLICFNDLNGNKIKDENEPPLPNIQVTFQRTTPLNDSDEVAKINTGFAEIELITSPDGQVYYGNIPEGVYFINFKPLANLKDLYNVNGDQQTVRISSNNTTYFVPFAETYKVKGKVLIERDEFSSEGSLSFEGIRVTAIDSNGESYSVLTDKKGGYMLSVPQAQTYKVKVNQVFGEQFICERPEYNIHFNGIKVINLDFKFYEKKRKVNFDSAIDALYIFNSLNTTSSKTKLGNEGFKADIDTSKVLRYVDQILDTNEKLANLYPVSSVTDAGTVFKIDLYPPTNKRLTKEQVTLPSVICIEENSLYRYFANTFQNYQDAKDYLEEIQDLGVSTAKIVSFKDGKEISLKEAGVENE